MALKLKIDKLEDVSEDLRDMYEEGRNGGFEIKYDWLKDHPGVAKLRSTTNDVDKKRVDAEKALAALTEKFDGLDADAAREALKKIEDLGDKDLIDEGKIEELLEKKTERMRADFAAQLEAKDKALAEAEAKIEKSDQEISDYRIFDTIKEAALAKGARKDALGDIKNRAASIWRLEDGKPAAMDDDGAILGKRGEPLTIEEWVDTLASESAFLFEPNKGGGADGNDNKNQFSGSAKVVTLAAGQDDISKIASGEAVIDHGSG